MYLKLHLFVTIVLTQLAALFYVGPYASLPYFPIEISRTAATNPLSKIILLVGLVTSFVHLPFYNRGVELYIAWMGMVILAVFDDVTYWSIHMFGNIIMIIAGCYSIINSK